MKWKMIEENNNHRSTKNKTSQQPFEHPSLKGIKYVLFPHNKYVQLWENCFLCVLIYYCFAIPYTVGCSGGYWMVHVSDSLDRLGWDNTIVAKCLEWVENNKLYSHAHVCLYIIIIFCIWMHTRVQLGLWSTWYWMHYTLVRKKNCQHMNMLSDLSR